MVIGSSPLYLVTESATPPGDLLFFRPYVSWLNPNMEAKHTEQLLLLFEAALEQAPDERTAFLEEACPDETLRQEVINLLNADAELDESFLESLPTALDLNPIAVDPAPNTFVGRRIGSYQILRRLGSGGMGAVFLARREEPFKQYAALKLIRSGVESREIRRRFEMERQILASLTHPNIARLLDGGTTKVPSGAEREGLPYLVMEYVEGRPITTYCDAQMLSVEQRLGLFEQVCQAVHYAHQNLVVHRDLKPSNILVTQKGTVKLLDFGVAKLLNPSMSYVEAPITQTKYRVMTPEYAAPEQVRGESVTTATDVYALGALLYELLTGRRPHRLTSHSPVEIARAICDEEVPRPSTRVIQNETRMLEGETQTIEASKFSAARSVTVERLQRHLQGDLDNIILKAMRKEPHLRYASAEQLGADIRRHLQGHPVEARPASVGYRMRKFVQRHQIGVLAALLVLVSLVVGLGAALRQTAVAEQAQARAEVEAESAQQIAQFLEGVFGAATPSGRRPGSLTARELLDRGVERVDQQLAEQPNVQAAMLTVLGRVYTDLNVYDTAGVLLDRSLALLQEQAAPPLDLAKTVEARATLYRYLNDFAMADSLYRQALAIRQEAQGPFHTDVGALTMARARTLNRWGHHDEAVATADEAVEIYRTAVGDHTQTAEALLQAVTVGNQRLALRPEGRTFAEYEKNYAMTAEALDIQRRHRGSLHTRVGEAYQMMASLYMTWARDPYFPETKDSLLQRAVESLDRKLEILDATVGLETIEYISARSLQAGLMGARGDREGAAEARREVFLKSEAVYGENHGTRAMLAHNLSMELAQIGQPDSALAMAQLSLEILQRNGNTSGAPYAARWLTVGIRANQTGNMNLACEAYRETVAVFDAMPPDDVPSAWYAQGKGGIGVCLAQARRDRQAEQYLRESYAVLEAQTWSFADFIYIRRRVIEASIDVYERLNQPDEVARFAALLEVHP